MLSGHHFYKFCCDTAKYSRVAVGGSDGKTGNNRQNPESLFGELSAVLPE
jgi:hypothetical protein